MVDECNVLISMEWSTECLHRFYTAVPQNVRAVSLQLRQTQHGAEETCRNINHLSDSIALTRMLHLSHRYWFSSVQFSSVQFSHSTDWVVGGGRGCTENDSVQIFFQSFLQVIVSCSGLDRVVHSLTLSIHASPLPTAASPTLQGALKDGFGEAPVTLKKNALTV